MRFIGLFSCTALAATTSIGLVNAAPTKTPDASLQGTPVRLRLDMDLRSGRDKVGEPVLFTVNETVYGPHRAVLLEKGDIARGHVTESSKHGAFGHNGKLTFTCDYAIAHDGSRVLLFLVVVAEAAVQREDSKLVGDVGAAVTVGRYSPGYANSPEAYEDYQQTGVTAEATIDPTNLLRNGDDETADQGEQYEAVAVLPPAKSSSATTPSPPEQLFTLKDKSEITGVLLSFNGQVYEIGTPSGNRKLNVADVASITALPNASPR